MERKVGGSGGYFSGKFEQIISLTDVPQADIA